MWKAGSSLVTDRKLQLLTNTSSWSISQWSWWKGLLIHKAVQFLLFSFFSNTVLLNWYLCKLVTFSAQSRSLPLSKVLHDFALFYRKDLLQRYQPVRNLSWSQNNLGLTIQNFNLQFYGRRVFSGAAPHLWNHLPEDIKNADSIRKLQTLLVNRTF